MLTPTDLLKRLRLGEDSTLELKRVLTAGSRVTDPRRNDLADELAAFANSRGGTLILGVDDSTREVLGLPLDRLDAVEAWVRETCNDSIKPALDLDIRKLELPDAQGRPVPVIVLEVPQSLFVHRSPGGYFRRLGSSKREMSPEWLARLLQERSQSRVIRYDESLVPRTSPQDLDEGLPAGSAGAPEGLTRPGASCASGEDDSGQLRLTFACVLMCTAEPTRWLPHAYIQAVSYAGDRQDVNYQTDSRDVEGPLDEQVFEALHFVRRNMAMRASKVAARVENPQFSERAVFEALVNAVAHRDYSMAGARIRLHLFGDRLELFVPGGLANTLTPESMALRQYSRNELLVSLLARCPVAPDQELGRSFLMDRRGDGVPIILEESRRLSGKFPSYEVLDDSEVRLVIWAVPAEATETPTITQEELF